MQRRALIVAGAAGSEEEAIGLLRRFGFASIVHSDTVASALEQLAGAHFDLVVLPVYEISAEELATLERIVRQDRYTFVIGTAPQANPESILRAMRAGVHEFLTSPPDAREFTAAVDRLQRRVQVERRQGQVIAVHSAKGGLGTTSIAVNLAAALASNRRDAR